MIIGICGKSGSGKSTIAKQITSRYKNAIHLDIDKIVHKSHKDEEVKQKIISTFTESVLTNNEIDRKKFAILQLKYGIDLEEAKSLVFKYGSSFSNEMLQDEMFLNLKEIKEILENSEFDNTISLTENKINFANNPEPKNTIRNAINDKPNIIFFPIL